MLLSTRTDGDRLIFKATAPHFFKVVLDNTIREKKLGIPTMFIRKYAYGLPNTVLLKVPSGDAWRVELLTCNGEVWLQKGWQEFMEFYSLVCGSFLVFQYDPMDCHFNVIIFDASASEIDYPCKSEPPEAVINLEEEFVETRIEHVECNDSVEILSCSSLSRKGKEKSPSPVVYGLKKLKTENPRDEKARVLDRAKAAFKSKNPFFMVVMQPSYIDPGGQVTIEASFAHEYLEKGCGDAMLNVMDDDRTWTVKYTYGQKRGRTKANFRNGWKKFIQDNHLNVGDVCIFELICRKQTTFRVFIYRNLRDRDCCPSIDGSKVVIRSLKVPNIEVAETLPSPSFEVIIKSDNLKRLLYVPFEFTLKCTEQNVTNITLEVKNRRWDVKLIKYGSRGIFSAGWCAFARENCLQAGDVCIFKLVNAKTRLIEVSISRRHVK